MKNSKSKFLFLLIFLSLSVNVFAVDIETIGQIEKQLNENFKTEIKQSGSERLTIFLDSSIPTYAGGVNIKDNQIVVTIGSEQAIDYSLGAFSFIVCHELGHIIGGAPYKTEKLGSQYKELKISSEGQSDYWAGSSCLSKLIDNPKEGSLDFFRYLSNSLKDIVGGSSFYAIPDPNIVDDYYYDTEYASFQCRYQSVLAGIDGNPRPSCWYRP